jgi:hypothetical protein
MLLDEQQQSINQYYKECKPNNPVVPLGAVIIRVVRSVIRRF